MDWKENVSIKSVKEDLRKELSLESESYKRPG